ncbi:MAG: hypothetical protein KKB62_00445 [Nanoarchaeota archaeon]|nr:hypothetical protein [Nanoarchaeota archaeon]
MKKNYFVFLQALLFTIVIFLVGFYIGMSIEGKRMVEINDYYLQSEVSLVDVLSLNKLVGSGEASCEELVRSDKELLDKVYGEARLLTQYEESGKLTNQVKNLHLKYDVLRTYLWITSIEIKKECSTNLSTIVYLYNHGETDLTNKAKQVVWSKLLLEVKEVSPEVVLIPIAADSDLVSLKAITGSYNITSFPVVIVNEKYLFYEIPPKERILELVNKSF